MGAGGWNKGIKNSTGTAFKNKKHKPESIEKLKNRAKDVYKKPKAEPIDTTDLCEYGCEQIAKYKFANNKICCSTSHNSCQGKRKAFSELDHTARTSKSLATRIEKGITKSSQLKGGATRIAQGHYKKLAKTMQKHWLENPWQNNIKCPLVPYKETELLYQGTFEYNFLESWELLNGIDWVANTIKRGPAIWYIDPTDSTERLYISDFLIYNTIYEIKSAWTWNKQGKDIVLETKNKAKLAAAKSAGYNVKLVLDKEEIDAPIMD